LHLFPLGLFTQDAMMGATVLLALKVATFGEPARLAGLYYRLRCFDSRMFVARRFRTTTCVRDGLLLCSWADELTLIATTETPRRNALKRRPGARMIVATCKTFLSPVILNARSQQSVCACRRGFATQVSLPAASGPSSLQRKELG
jgi:hypothetical protein